MKIMAEMQEGSNTATVEIEGNGPEILRGFALLLIGFSEKYHVDIAKLSVCLPMLVANESTMIAQKTLIDLGAVEKAANNQGGGAHE